MRPFVPSDNSQQLQANSATQWLTLSRQELAFFRVTCDLFPVPESPLRFLNLEEGNTVDSEAMFHALQERGLLNDTQSGASALAKSHIVPVAECDARIIVRHSSHDPHANASSTTAPDPASQEVTDDWGEQATVEQYFYVSHPENPQAAQGPCAVGYRQQEETFSFSPPMNETTLARNLAGGLTVRSQVTLPRLHMSAGDYLVFSMFARDVRAALTLTESESGVWPESASSPEDDSPMSLDEVLAFFDEPELNELPAADDSWQQSVDSLCDKGVLNKQQEGYILDPSLHSLALEIAAENRVEVTRFDFMDGHWLVRELSLYPGGESLYRLDTAVDGAMVLEELSQASLTAALEAVVVTLPNILQSMGSETVIPSMHHHNIVPR